MDPAAAPPAMPPIASITSPLLLGSLCNTFLFGIVSVQLYFYYLSFPSDALYIKFLVYGVYAMDTAATVMNVSDMYEWFAKGFGDVQGLDRVLLSPVYTPILGSFIAGTVQSFYAYRIFMIDRRAWPMSIFVMLVVFTQIAGGLWGGIIAMRDKSFLHAAANASGSPWILFVGAAVADTAIALTVIGLLGRKMAESHRQIHSNLSRIIQLTAETNLLSTVVALTTMILFAAEKGTNYFTLPSFILGKVYSNSLLLILNNRWFIGAGAEQTRGPTFGSSHPSNTAVSMSLLRNKGLEKEQPRGHHVEMNNRGYASTDGKQSGWIPDRME